MKKIMCSYYFLFFFSFYSFSQIPVDTALQHQSYVFDNFTNGTVLSKSGEINTGLLNYCAYDQSILFMQGEQIMTLAGLENIDTIYFNNKKFIPFNNIVYELIEKGNVQLYLSYTCKMHPWEATTDRNGSALHNSNEVSNTVSSAYITRPFKGNFSLEIVKQYWLKSNNKFYKANVKNDFLKVFKESANPLIKNFVATSNLDFKKEADLITLVDFCNKNQ